MSDKLELSGQHLSLSLHPTAHLHTGEGSRTATQVHECRVMVLLYDFIAHRQVIANGCAQADMLVQLVVKEKAALPCTM